MYIAAVVLHLRGAAECSIASYAVCYSSYIVALLLLPTNVRWSLTQPQPGSPCSLKIFLRQKIALNILFVAKNARGILKSKSTGPITVPIHVIFPLHGSDDSSLNRSLVIDYTVEISY